MKTKPTEEVTVYKSEEFDEDPEEDPEEEYEEYIEEVSEEELESNSKEESEKEPNVEPKEETGFHDKFLKDKITSSKTTDESALKEKRHKTRWDLLPEQDGEKGEEEKDINVKKSRWGSDVSQLKTGAPFQLPESLSDFVDFESNSKLRWLKKKLVVVSEEILKLQACKGNTEKGKGRRTHIKGLLRKKQKLLAELLLEDSKLRVPDVCGQRKNKILKKVYIPVKEYPSYNFVGLILGPSGNTQKKMEVESGASIKVQGKGSQCRAAKPEDDDENLHVYIEAYTEKSVEAAVAMVEKLLVPLDDKDNKFKLAQLEELANIRGTNFNACPLCNDPSHKIYACPNHKSNFEKVISCTKCGSFSHLISQCPLNTKPDPIKVINEANLYVGFLPQSADDNWLKDRFCPFGKIISVREITNHTTGLSKGYGFVNFESPVDAAMAVKHMNGHQLEGRTLAVRVAGLPPQPKVPVLNPFPPYPRSAAISPNIPGFMDSWAGPPGLIVSPQFPLQPGLPANLIPPYPRPAAAISPNIPSQMGPWSGFPGSSQNTKDSLGQYYTPSSNKATDMPSQVDPNYVYAKQGLCLASGSSQFPGDPNYRSSSSLFPGDPDYRGLSSLF